MIHSKNIFCISADSYSCALQSYVCILAIKNFVLARWSPGIHIEIFSSNEPIHSNLFWPCRYVLELLADALLTSGIEFFTEILLIMDFHFMSTKAFRIFAQPETFWLFLLVPISYLKFGQEIRKFPFPEIAQHDSTSYQSFCEPQWPARTYTSLLMYFLTPSSTISSLQPM